MEEPVDPFRFDNYEASPEPKKKPFRPTYFSNEKRNWESRQCKFCDEIFECSNGQRKNQLTKIRHHTLNHFKDRLALLLPKEKPWECPMPDCEYIGKSLLDLIRHYAFIHNQIEDYCSKDDLHGIAVESQENMASANKPENKNEEFGIKYFLKQSENTLRDEESDGNNNFDDTLDELRRKLNERRKQQNMPKPSNPKGHKTEEEKKFDYTLTNSVNKVSFWFGHGNIDGEELTPSAYKPNTSTIGSTSLKVRTDLGSLGSEDEGAKRSRSEEQKYRNTIKLESDTDQELDNYISKNNEKSKRKIKVDPTKSKSSDEERVPNTDQGKSQQPKERLNGRTEEMLEQSRSVLSNIMKSDLAPPKKTFSMDPFGQKSNAPTSKLPSSDPMFHPSPWRPKAYVDPFSEISPTKNKKSSYVPDIYDDEYDSLVNFKKSNEKASQNMHNSSPKSASNQGSSIEKDAGGNYTCPKCKLSSKLRIQIVKHLCV